MERVTRSNNSEFNAHGAYVLYWMTAYRRIHFNFALERALFWAGELRRPLLIFEALSCSYRWASARFHQFMIDGMSEKVVALRGAPVSYVPYVERFPGEGKKFFAQIASKACLIVTDDFPAFEISRWVAKAAAASRILVEKVDSNGLLPMRATDRVFLTAASFRRYVQMKDPGLGSGLPADMPVAEPLAGVDLPRLAASDLPAYELTMPNNVDRSVAPVAGIKGGTGAARERLRMFLSSDRSSSGLSPYLHFGHISAHEVFREVRQRRRNSEHFLDELVTWRELGFNMCAHVAGYDRYESLPQWARNTLARHASDARPVRYSPDQLENASTHDSVWNSAQIQLLTEGRIENRLRMLWGKKIVEWSSSPQEALEVMIHLNNKYALDGRDPNSYTGIFWVLGRYDRPWGPERPIFGLVRYMSSENTVRKLRATR
jgi:deoxyribodipyrimidine photo-lyase